MRRVVITVAMISMLVLPASGWSKGKGNGKGGQGGIPCPADVSAAVEAECPCDGTTAADGSVTPWRNHGRYVRCARQFVKKLEKSGEVFLKVIRGQ